ncbi:MAG: hypothetical protein HRT88_13955, partial [Lentisphaeraceae bacterium]|nr:hypothetical protein [Lentisphaeraceae bacterium]
YWGFCGEIGPRRFRIIVKSLSYGQKEELSEALNFYYNRGLAKYTSGVLLRCEAKTDSILEQFSWFHRNTLTYYAKGDPAYHEIIQSTLEYFELAEDEELEWLSTSQMERRLIYWEKKKSAEEGMTEKDKTAILLSLLDVGASLAISSSTPIGFSVTLLSYLHKSGSDPAKTVPAIVVFHRLRTGNFIYTLCVLTLLSVLLSYTFLRRK